MRNSARSALPTLLMVLCLAAPLFAEMMVLPQRPERDDQERPPFLRMFSGPAHIDASGNFVLRNLARAKLRRSAEAEKINLELKPGQNLTDHNVIFKP